MRFSPKRTRVHAGAAAAGIGLLALSGSIIPTGGVAQAANLPTSVQLTASSNGTTGLPAGTIKHVWLIILENKSYDATFTGLNNNSYLWKTLPSQGVELKNYYGTGHSSQDNYLSMVSGQAPEEDVQNDCSVQDYNFGSNATTVSDTASANFGQVASTAGPNAENGENGCTFPTSAPTLFNQLDAAGVTWKGYAQDLGGASANSPTSAPNGTGTLDLRPDDGSNLNTTGPADNTVDRDASACGGPGSANNFPGAQNTGAASLTGSTSTNTPGTYGVTTFTSAQPDDQYVAKHFPFPWFHSLTGTGAAGITTPTESGEVQGTDCDSAHIANLESATNGLVHDLQSEATTPAFSWITPDNCSDAHDAVCKGNNLSGAFNDEGDPIYNTSPRPYDPESTTPTNYTGGLYASDLFLRYYIPLIEQSPAFKDGGLIDVTFDEANPPFTYSGNSFNNQPAPGAAANPTPTQGDTTQPADCSTATGDNTVIEPCTASPGTDPTTGTVTNPSAYAPGASSVYGAYGILADAAGENINGQNVNSEPTGVNSTLAREQLVHRPTLVVCEHHHRSRLRPGRRWPLPRRPDRRRGRELGHVDRRRPEHPGRRHRTDRDRRRHPSQHLRGHRDRCRPGGSTGRQRGAVLGLVPAGRRQREPGDPDRRCDQHLAERRGCSWSDHHRADRGPALRRHRPDTRRR
jgi:hypothetical protein